MIKLTKEEKRNGWTPEKLEKYRKEREESAVDNIFKPRSSRPDSQERYQPLKWRD